VGVSDFPELVILVDNDEEVLRSLDRLLRSSGFDCEAYSSPLQFLERDQPDCPACAILDLSMPQMSGLQVQQEIAHRELPYGVVILTGHGDVPASVRAMKLGAIDFLAKPVDEEDLIRAVREALDRQQQVFELRAHYVDLRDRFAPLTDREHEVMELVVAGYLNKQIAHDLGISEKTVKAHRAKVMQKTGTKSLAKLVQLHSELRQTSASDEAQKSTDRS
jgi:FixJ family two-component response regulator